MRKLLILTLALLFFLPLFAENEEKYSITTQLFLSQQSGKLNPKPRKLRRSSNVPQSVAEPALTSLQRLIVSPEEIDGVMCISSFIRLTDNSDVSELESLGVIVRAKFANGLITAFIPVDKIEEVAAIGKVTKINVASLMRSFTDKGREYTNTDDVLEYTASAVSAGLPNAYDGSGVLLGITDSGIDFQHVAFKDADGGYRAVGAYQVKATQDSYGEYSYTRNEYNQSTMANATTDDESDHGTHTSSTAGGSSVVVSGSNVTVTDNHANATYGGMAPGSDLWLAGVGNLNNADLATSFKKIISYAEAHDNMPVVISNSWGSGWGPRDGTSDFADVVSEYFGDDHPNRVCLFASSNDAGSGSSEGGGFHVTGTASSASPLGTIIRCDTYSTDPGHTYSGLVAAAWGRSSSDLRCKLYVLNKSTGAIVASTSAITPGTSVTSLSSYYNGEIYVYSDSQNGKAGCQVWADIQATSGSSSSCPYTLAAEFYPSSGSTTIDVWAGDSYGWFVGDNFVTTTNHTWTCGTDDMSVSDEATIPNAISVGAYVSKETWNCYNGQGPYYIPGQNSLNDIANFSSYATAAKSPTGQFYPWITAPGAQIVSAVNHYSSDYTTGSMTAYRVNTNTTYPYAVMQGTSMATPTAAGIVALWLQVAKENNVELTTNDIKTIMAETAIKDSYVTSGANASHFGNGKIDALAGIQYILDNYVQEPAVAAPELDAAGSVGTDRFTASWSAVKGADSYTLEIGKAAAEPTSVSLLNVSFASGAPSGWTTSGYTTTESSTLRLGSNSATGSVTSPAVDLSSYSTVTAKVTARYFNTDESSLKVSIVNASGTELATQTVSLTNTAKQYNVVLSGNFTSSSKLVLASIAGKKRVNLTSVELVSGDASTSSGAPRLREVSDVTDGDVRTISGITGTSHVVTGLEAGATYKFKVKAVSGTDESRWSNEETVKTLEGDPVPEFDVEPSSLTMTATVGESATATVDVYGLNLTQNASLTIGGTDASLFSVTPNTLTPAQAADLTTVTVTYSPTAVGTHTATLTIASEGAESVDIPITGTATAAPVVTPTLVVVGDATVAVAATVGQSATETFSVLGSDLTGDVTLTLADESGYFAINSTTIAKADAEEGAVITVTYSPAEAGEHTATVTISSDGAESETVTLNGTATTPPDPTADRTFKLAKNLSDLDGVTEIILVNPIGQTGNLGSVAMSTTQNTNNRPATSITLSDNNNIATVPANNTSIVVLTLGKTTMTIDDTPTTVYTFYDEANSGYLYAASSTSNHLKTQTTLDDNGKATISIASDGAATILFQGTNSRNSLRYNNNQASSTTTNNLFACYAENTSTLPRAYIYYYEGNVEPTPELVVDPAAVNITANAGETATATFSVLGSDLTDEVTLTLTDANNCFSINPATISVADAEDGAEVTITFVAPSTGGNYSATVTVASAGATSAEVALSGSAVLQKAVPVMSPADTDTEVGDTWFDAKWTDATPAANVSSYTLYVNKVEETPEPETIDVYAHVTDASTLSANDKIIIVSTGADEGVSAMTATSTGSGNSKTLLATTSGFTYNSTDDYFVLADVSDVVELTLEGKADEWKLKSGTNYLSVNKGDYTAMTLVSTNNSEIHTISISSGNATIMNTSGSRVLMYNYNNGTNPRFGSYASTYTAGKPVQIYKLTSIPAPSSGAPRLKAVEETGDASTRTITGISGDTKTYRVSGLTPGAKYDYQVKAVYVDQTESAWSNEERVTLKLTPHTLAEMVADGTLGVGDSYAIADGNLLAVMLSADGKTLFCKDANGYAQKQSASGSQVDYMVEYGFETPLEYDQSNWVALTSESALSGDLVGNYLTGVSGTVSDLANPSLALAAAPAVGESGRAYLSGTPNRFIPTSFMGESVVESGGKAFFFVAPKPVEVAIVTWACWNGSKFVSVPKTTYTKKDGVTSTMNPYNLQGEFTVDTKYLESWPTLTENDVYEFTAVITREGGLSPAPGRLKSATSAGGYGIYPLSAPTSIGSVGGTVTGITGVNGNGAAVESVTIYNSVGVRQSELQRGVNIIVTRYTDGTTRTVKILK